MHFLIVCWDSIYLTESLNFLNRPLLSNWPTDYTVCSCHNTFWAHFCYTFTLLLQHKLNMCDSIKITLAIAQIKCQSRFLLPMNDMISDSIRKQNFGSLSLTYDLAGKLHPQLKSSSWLAMCENTTSVFLIWGIFQLKKTSKNQEVEIFSTQILDLL